MKSRGCAVQVWTTSTHPGPTFPFAPVSCHSSPPFSSKETAGRRSAADEDGSVRHLAWPPIAAPTAPWSPLPARPTHNPLEPRRLYTWSHTVAADCWMHTLLGPSHPRPQSRRCAQVRRTRTGGSQPPRMPGSLVLHPCHQTDCPGSPEW